MPHLENVVPLHCYSVKYLHEEIFHSSWVLSAHGQREEDRERFKLLQVSVIDSPQWTIMNAINACNKLCYKPCRSIPANIITIHLQIHFVFPP